MEKYKKGDIVIGRVTGIEKYGVFVSIDGTKSGLIHISEISDSFVKNPSDYVSIGEIIKAKVLECGGLHDLKMKLSIKNIDYRINSIHEGKIKETKSGFASLRLNLPIWINKKEQKLMHKLK